MVVWCCHELVVEALELTRGFIIPQSLRFLLWRGFFLVSISLDRHLASCHPSDPSRLTLPAASWMRALPVKLLTMLAE